MTEGPATRNPTPSPKGSPILGVGSGTLDFSEFIMLVRSMNPKGDHTEADPDKKETGLFGNMGSLFS